MTPQGAAVRVRVHGRARALRAAGPSILQTAIAASLAWLIAHDLLNHAVPFFAPVAAVLVLGLSPGGKTSRAVEMVGGVAVGILIGDLIASAIDQGWLRIGLVVLLAMTAAVLIGGGPLVISQAASSGVVVAAFAAPNQSLIPSRFVDTLIGGTVGLVVVVFAPRNPIRLVRRAANPVFSELRAVLTDTREALARSDLEGAERALLRARAIDDNVVRLKEALAQARETTVLAPSQWSERGHIERYSAAAVQIELATRNARVLARAAVRAVELESRVPDSILKAISDLSLAAGDIQRALIDDTSGEDARTRLLEASAAAGRALDEPHGFAVDVLVGQIRSMATDLLRALGFERDAAVSQIRTAAGDTPLDRA